MATARAEYKKMLVYIMACKHSVMVGVLVMLRYWNLASTLKVLFLVKDGCVIVQLYDELMGSQFLVGTVRNFLVTPFLCSLNLLNLVWNGPGTCFPEFEGADNIRLATHLLFLRSRIHT
jgi:hypothetical protein